MESISASPLTTSFASQLGEINQKHALIGFKTRLNVKTRRFLSNSSRNAKKVLTVTRGCASFGLSRCSTSPNGPLDEDSDGSRRCLKQGRGMGLLIGSQTDSKGTVVQCMAKPLIYALICIVVGFSPIRSFQAPAAALPVLSEVIWKTKKTVKDNSVVLKKKDHPYFDYTRRLLETVLSLLRTLEDVRNGNGDVDEVSLALEVVKRKKDELEGEILSGLHRETKDLENQKTKLVKRAEELISEAQRVKKESEKLVGEGQKDEVKKLEERADVMEKEYNALWETVDDIEEQMLKKETLALSYGARELCFIERECEELVNRFYREMRWKNAESLPKRSASKLSRSEIKEDLEKAQKKHLEQTILPNVVELENFGPLYGQDSADFALRIKQCLEDSKKLQKTLEDRIRRKMKKFGSEKRIIVKTPQGEVVKGFPDVEPKWMFGDKEIVMPKAIELHLYHGWKKWQEEAKADLKRNLLDDVEFGKQYVAQRQERILLDRDKLVSKTWYNEDKRRWEMDPVAVPYAISRKLVEKAIIRHDWAAMYLSLKGDDREYYVDIEEYEVLYEEFGGFDAVYMKMLALGIPTAVHLMWIPISELNLQQQFLLTTRIVHRCLCALWKNQYVSHSVDWVVENIKNINDDIMVTIVFPVVDFIIPYQLRLLLGMAWPEEISQTVGSTWYLQWQSEAEMNFKSRNTEDFQWFFWFFVRSVIYIFALYHILRFLKRKVPKLLGYGPLRRDPNARKLRRVQRYFNYKKKKIKQQKKAGIDPIRTAFDKMKRVKNPPIPLKNFASIESMREEINEVVAFLQNPKAFQEMGARAPRGVLIVGERGTGKSSLALAIAAEARVPVVNLKAQELEAGLWVGQSAANVRELFQTARDLAPVILFVEDFDLFAGVRGKFIHTKEQDHEAFINQLLVELDGFEKQDGVVLMATTRNLKQIDEALRRPGRMDRVFHLQRPTDMERENILRIAANETMDEGLIGWVDWRKVAEKTALLRPIELKLVPAALEGAAFRNKFLDTDELMSYCNWFATFSVGVPNWLRKTKVVKKISKMLVNHLGLTLTKEDLQSVVDLMEPYGQIDNGIELLSPPTDWTRETKFPHAVWAAGRGLLAHLIPNFDLVDNLWLEPRSWQGIGCTKITKARSRGSANGNSESRSYLEKRLVFCFGSHIASQMLLPFGEENYLSTSELKQAQEIATRMVIQYGWGPDDSPVVYYANGAYTALSMGNNHEFEMAAKVEKIYDMAYQRGKEMLVKNRQVLEKIVEELLEFEILSGKDLERLFAENGGVREEEPFFLSKASHERWSSRSFLEDDNQPETVLIGAPT